MTHQDDRCPYCFGTGWRLSIDATWDAAAERWRPRPGVCGAPWWDLSVDPPAPRSCTAPTRTGLCPDHARQLDWIATRSTV